MTNEYINSSGETKFIHTPPDICIAAAINDAELLVKCIHEGVSVNVVDCYFGQSPLHRAAENGRKDIVEFLINFGAEIDMQDRFGHTALFLALLKDRIATARCLIRGGADLNIASKTEDAPLHIICSGDVDRHTFVSFMIKSGAFVNPIRFGPPPLHLAIQGGLRRTTEVLLQNGAQTGRNSDCGKNAYSAIDVAVGCNQPGIVELLIKHGSKKSELGKAAREYAIKNGFTAALNALE